MAPRIYRPPRPIFVIDRYDELLARQRIRSIATTVLRLALLAALAAVVVAAVL